MNTKHPDFEHVMELLAGRALGDLDQSETAELNALLGKMTPDQASAVVAMQSEYERLVGATLAGWETGASMQRKLPPELRERILSAGLSALRKGEGVGAVEPIAHRMKLRECFAWFTAAASIALAVFAWNRSPSTSMAEPSWKAREDLLQQPDSTKLTWSTTNDPDAKGVSGDIVWNAHKQKGYMRFKGLASNDPRLQQYQLWIFDKGREGDFPVDGGVFDIDSATKDPRTGDLVVPITPKLAVRDPALFAITLELPGGVVVTKKERLLLLAKTEEK